jgi:hypothetical protein
MDYKAFSSFTIIFGATLVVLVNCTFLWWRVWNGNQLNALLTKVGGIPAAICVCQCLIDIREYIDCSLAQPACLVLVECYVASHCLAVAPQSGAKQIFYCFLYYITLNSNCKAQKASKNLKKI